MGIWKWKMDAIVSLSNPAKILERLTCMLIVNKQLTGAPGCKQTIVIREVKISSDPKQAGFAFWEIRYSWQSIAVSSLSTPVISRAEHLTGAFFLHGNWRLNQPWETKASAFDFDFASLFGSFKMFRLFRSPQLGDSMKLDDLSCKPFPIFYDFSTPLKIALKIKLMIKTQQHHLLM